MKRFSNNSIVFLILVAVCASLADGCDDGLLRRVGQTQTKTFYTSAWAPRLSWIEAQEFCNQAQPGMQMASIDNERERQVVYTFFVVYADQRKWYEFWVSGTDYGNEGNFTWMRSGQSVAFPIRQASGDLGKQENCLKVISNGAAFEDEACYGFTSERIWPLCQRMNPEITTTTLRPSTVPTTTTVAPPKEFECTSEGMHPDTESCDVYHVCVSHQGGFVDHKLKCPAFTNYCPTEKVCGYPTDCPCDLNLGSAQFNRDKEGSQNFSPSVIEVRPKFEKFPVRSLGTVGSKTYYTDTKSRNLNWIESMEFCHQNDMIMGRMETVAERSFLLKTLNSDYYINMFWLSALDYGSEGKYYWMNLGTTDHLNSIYGNGGRASNCLYLISSGPLYDWSCANHRNQKLWPLCEVTTDI